jgi:uncharacterized protein
MLLYRPVFREVEHMSKPANLAEAAGIAPGLTPVYAEAAGSMVDVETPTGEKLAIDDAKLIERLRQGIRDRHELMLLRCDRAMTDCRPISLFSTQTVQQLSKELGTNLTSGVSARYLPRSRVRNCFYRQRIHRAQAADWKQSGYRGDRPRSRCKMITLDPDTGHAKP